MSLPKIYAGRRRRWFRLLVANGAAQAVGGVALAALLKTAMSEARSGFAPWPAAGGIALVSVVLLALRFREARDAERLGQHFVMRVRLRIFDRLASRPERDTSAGRWGVTMTRLISDLNSLRNWVSTGVARAVVAGVSASGLLVGFAWIDPRASVAAGAMAAICLLAGLALTPRLRTYIRESRRRRGRLANNLGEKVLAVASIRELGRVRSERARIRKHSTTLANALVRRMGMAAVLRALPDAVFPLAVAGVAISAANHGSGAADAVVAVLLLGLVASAFRDLARAWDQRLAFDEGRRRIEQILAGPMIRESKNAVELTGEGPLRVEFESVALDGIFSEVDFRIEPGERVRLIGASGSGKSSLIALATRSFDPDEGEVLLNDVPLHALSLDSLHGAVQRVSPDLPLLRGTIAENVGYGAPDIDAGWMAEIVDACGLSDAREALPDGLDSRVEERGANLSEGLSARIALARACAIRPRLLLVDHPIFDTDATAARALERILEIAPFTSLIVTTDGSRTPNWGRVMELSEGKLQTHGEFKQPLAGSEPIPRAVGDSRTSA